MWTISAILWTIACFLGLLYLWAPPLKKGSNLLRKTYSLYLLCHVCQSTLSIDELFGGEDWALFLKQVFICTSGCSYVVLGALLYLGGGNMKANRSKLFTRAVAFACVLDLLGIILTATDLLDAGTVLAYVLGVAIATAFVLNEIFNAKVGDSKMRRALLFATVWGIIDGGVPLFLSGSTIQFLGRLFDSLFYVPPVIWALRQYDEKDVVEKELKFAQF